MNNEAIQQHRFLSAMYADGYYPHEVVDKGVHILERLCERIELEQPQSLAALYVLTHAATKQFNQLAYDFSAAESDLDTTARELIGAEFDFIAAAYGFAANLEALIAPRTW